MTSSIYAWHPRASKLLAYPLDIKIVIFSVSVERIQIDMYELNGVEVFQKVLIRYVKLAVNLPLKV